MRHRHQSRNWLSCCGLRRPWRQAICMCCWRAPEINGGRYELPPAWQEVLLHCFARSSATNPREAAAGNAASSTGIRADRRPVTLIMCTCRLLLIVIRHAMWQGPRSLAGQPSHALLCGMQAPVATSRALQTAGTAAAMGYGTLVITDCPAQLWQRHVAPAAASWREAAR